MPESCCTMDHTAAVVGLGMLFVTGVGVSLGHCMGMCGPLLLASFGASGRARVRDVALYHAGRVLMYALIGGVVGLLGAAGVRLGGGLPIGPVLALVLGALVIVLALPALRGGGTRSIGGTRAARAFSRLHARARGRGRFALGAANGLLPCGPVFLIALAAAATSHPGRAALSMFVFGLGTLPALFVLSIGAERASLRFRARLQRVSGWLVVLVGAQLGLRGLAAMGVLGHAALGRVVLW